VFLLLLLLLLLLLKLLFGDISFLFTFCSDFVFNPDNKVVTSSEGPFISGRILRLERSGFEALSYKFDGFILIPSLSLVLLALPKPISGLGL